MHQGRMHLHVALFRGKSTRAGRVRFKTSEHLIVVPRSKARPPPPLPRCCRAARCRLRALPLLPPPVLACPRLWQWPHARVAHPAPLCRLRRLPLCLARCRPRRHAQPPSARPRLRRRLSLQPCRERHAPARRGRRRLRCPPAAAVFQPGLSLHAAPLPQRQPRARSCCGRNGNPCPMWLQKRSKHGPWRPSSCAEGPQIRCSGGKAQSRKAAPAAGRLNRFI